MVDSNSDKFFRAFSRIADLMSVLGISAATLVLSGDAKAPTKISELELHNYCVDFAIHAAAKSSQPGALAILRLTSECKEKAHAIIAKPN
jgi:hypothetical protein